MINQVIENDTVRLISMVIFVVTGCALLVAPIKRLVEKIRVLIFGSRNVFSVGRNLKDVSN